MCVVRVYTEDVAVAAAAAAAATDHRLTQTHDTTTIASRSLTRYKLYHYDRRSLAAESTAPWHCTRFLDCDVTEPMSGKVRSAVAKKNETEEQ